eukprot:CAMPEP_0171071298 /NCGR_PEP_ID=MMETSP0766_2-20121228/10247_1 /TAXON_ID=439317 /ORGANISM="Gambierdiscus australes, Strain CAWD 149" /LENGTH=363 /DNA_ID=CAMNT_0011527833 /DNA_START=122 /DNA_END=1209 /DNA_ORIENTATION=+
MALSNFKDGDWHCAACGDHQFARNSQCRRCGAPKPVVSTNQQVAKPGDWICPNPACQDLQFERNPACRRCGTPKPVKSDTVVGERWNGEVVNLNARVGFGASKGGGVLPGAGCFDGALPQGIAADPVNAQGSHLEPEAQPAADDQGMLGGDSGLNFVDGELSGRASAGIGAGAPVPTARPANNQSMKEGDWLCTACGDHQFARNTVCRSCGAARPDEMGMSGRDLPGVRSATNTQRASSGGTVESSNSNGSVLESPRPGNNQEYKEGDWYCGKCGDHQFARNDTCRNCGAPRSAEGGIKGMGGMPRAGSPGATGCKGGCAGGYGACSYSNSHGSLKGGYAFGAVPRYMATSPYALASSYTAAG